MGSMVLRSSLILLLALAGIFFNSFNTGAPDNSKKEFFTLQAVIKFLDRVHYAPKTLDDDLSELIYDSYMMSLDPAKRFLTESEVLQLSSFEKQIDDEISTGSFQFFDLSVDLIANGIQRAETYFTEAIDVDFSLHDDQSSITMDGDARGFAADEMALKDYWTKLIRYEIMVKVHGLKKAKVEGDEPRSEEDMIKEARETVKKNFSEWFTRLNSLRRSDRFEDYLNAVTGAYDPHSTYFSPRDKEDFDINMNGSYEGIGARLIPEGELIKVSQIIPGGPAWKQKGLEANDFIIMVAQEDEEPKDVRGWRQDDVIALIRGKKGTTVVLTVRKPDGSLEDIAIVRDQVILEEGRAKSLMLSLGNEGAEVGYIRLPKFYFEDDGKPGCAEDVANEIKKLDQEGAKGVILDLRNNGGGSLSEVVDMSGLFFEKGPVVQVKSRDRKPYVLEDEDPAVQYRGPLIVMVNHFSASASEIIAAALQDYNRAIIVGSNSTFGKGTVQRFHALDRFIVGNNDLKPLGEVKITTQKFYRINGGSTQLRGVEPDIVLPTTYNYIKVGEKEYETPLKWTEIEPVDYDAAIAGLPDKEILAAYSAERVKNHPTFQLIEERALSLKEQEESDLTYPLNIEGYEKILKDREEQNAKFKNMFKPIDGLIVKNLDSELNYINEDETRKANNEDLITGIQKDVYIEEVMHIMKDMLGQQ